jgi:hypothetical protein
MAMALSASAKKLGRQDHMQSESRTWPEYYQHWVSRTKDKDMHFLRAEHVHSTISNSK